MSNLYDKCLAHWKMNDNAASTTVLDSKGSNNGVAQQNTSALATTGKVGGGLDFNGATDYIAITVDDINLLAAPISIFAWIYPDNQDGIILIKSSGGANIQYGYGFYVPENRIIVYLKEAVAATSANNSVMPSTWSFVGFTWDGTNVKVYVNGAQSGSTGSVSGSLTEQAVCAIGTSPVYGGVMDDIMLFNAALTQEEITFLYNGGFGTEHLDFPQNKITESWSDGWGF